MKYEYLVFNLIIIAGPLLLSFDRRVNYVRKWSTAFASLMVPMFVFIGWDIAVTGRHWWFNENYTLSLSIAGLPVGEWLFFITVAFSCLFIWEVLAAYLPNRPMKQLRFLQPILYTALPAGLWMFLSGTEYTGLVLISTGLIGIADRLLKINLFLQSRTYLFLTILTGLMLVFNGYLTARPVVLYNSAYQLDFRIFTIPIEDFGYGFAYLLFCTMIYEKLKASPVWINTAVALKRQLKWSSNI